MRKVITRFPLQFLSRKSLVKFVGTYVFRFGDFLSGEGSTSSLDRMWLIFLVLTQREGGHRSKPLISS
jgi:hypothetical protein